MANKMNCAKNHDRTRIDQEARKGQRCESMKKLRAKRKMEENVEGKSSDEEIKNVEEHIEERNEEHAGDEEMTNVEGVIGSVDIDTMIGE